MLGSGNWRVIGGLTASLASGTGSSDPLGSGDQALSLAGFPSVTNLQATAGLEFTTRTKGYQNITFRFDLRATATACRHVRAWYSSDGGAHFIAGPRYSLTKAGEFSKGLLLELPPACADQPEVRVQLIAEAEDAERWVGVSANYNPAGTWRVDQVMFVGDPLEPSIITPPISAPVLSFTNHITGRVHAGEPATNSFAELVLRPGETLRLVVNIHDTNGYPVQISAAPGARPAVSTWTLPNSPSSTSLALFTCSISEVDAGQEFQLGLNVENGAVTRRQWTLYVPSAAERAISIGEFLADPPAGTSEFVELVHQGISRLDLSGWTLTDGSSVRHRFPSGSSCANHGSIVVWGGSMASIPSSTGGEVDFLPASSGGLSLNNTGDVLHLRNARSNLIERVAYRGVDLGSGGSLSRSTFPDGPFRAHRSLSPELWSPGRTLDDRLWSEIGPSPDAPRDVRISFDASGYIRVEWERIPGRPVRILRTSDLISPFEEIGRELMDGIFFDDSGLFTAFYQVEWQP